MKKIFNKVNGSIAIFYGLSGLAATVVCAYFTIKIIARMISEDEFSWGGFGGLLVLIFAIGFIGYAHLKVGQEQFRR